MISLTKCRGSLPLVLLTVSIALAGEGGLAGPCESQSILLPIKSEKNNTNTNSTLGEEGIIMIPILQTGNRSTEKPRHN